LVLIDRSIEEMAMPRRLVHDLAGTVAGLAAWFTILYFRGDVSRTVEAIRAGGISLTDILEITVFIGLAVIGSRLPDKIEPPVSRQHRGVFHNFTLFVILTLLILYWAYSDPSSLSRFVLSFIYGYDSHLFLDALA